MLHCTLLLLYSKFWFITHYYNGNHLNYIRFQVLGVGLEMSSFATLPLSKAKHQRVSACTVTAYVEIHLAELFHLLTSFPQTLVGPDFWKKNSTTPNKTTAVKRQKITILLSVQQGNCTDSVDKEADEVSKNV